jgi:cyclopropane fatty-acyl-phospholipid synthase-like methyltransferase
MKSKQNLKFDIDKKYLTMFTSDKEVNQLGWGSIHSQNSRFEILLQIRGYNQNDTVLDVGCGYGDLCKYIQNYTGIDLRASAIDKAKNKYPGRDFKNCEIYSIDEKYDWVFASGIFCFDYEWEKNTNDCIKKMYEISKKGLAFNFLSDLSEGNREIGMKYTKIEEALPIVSSLCKNFTFRHDYLKNDFTVYMYK